MEDYIKFTIIVLIGFMWLVSNITVGWIVGGEKLDQKVLECIKNGNNSIECSKAFNG